MKLPVLFYPPWYMVTHQVSDYILLIFIWEFFAFPHVSSFQHNWAYFKTMQSIKEYFLQTLGVSAWYSYSHLHFPITRKQLTPKHGTCCCGKMQQLPPFKSLEMTPAVPTNNMAIIPGFSH